MKNMKIDDVTQALKNKVAENVDKNNKADENNAKDNSILVDALNTINDLNKKLKLATVQLQQQNQDYLSTTQFFNPTLAKDFYNMNGNALQTNSYMAVRQMIGICNNKTPNVMQSIPGINATMNNTNSINGTGVGLANNSNRQMSG